MSPYMVDRLFAVAGLIFCVWPLIKREIQDRALTKDQQTMEAHARRMRALNRMHKEV